MKNNKKMKRNWNKQDLSILLWVLEQNTRLGSPKVENYTDENWQEIAVLIPGKNGMQCMFKWLSLKKNNLNDFPWTEQQEQLLKRIVEEKGKNQWIEISQSLYLATRKETKIYRSPKQCREHWTCYMDPTLKKGPWLPAQDLLLLKEYMRLGKKWSQISKKMNGRTENAVKNRFNLLMIKQEKMFGKKKSQEQISVQYIKLLESEAGVASVQQSRSKPPLSNSRKHTIKEQQSLEDSQSQSESNSLELEPSHPGANIVTVAAKKSKYSGSTTKKIPEDTDTGMVVLKKAKSMAPGPSNLKKGPKKSQKEVIQKPKKQRRVRINQQSLPRKLKHKSDPNQISAEVVCKKASQDSEISEQQPRAITQQQIPVHQRSAQKELLAEIMPANTILPNFEVQPVKVIKFSSLPLSQIVKLGQYVPATFCRQSMEIYFQDRPPVNLYPPPTRRVSLACPENSDCRQFAQLSTFDERFCKQELCEAEPILRTASNNSFQVRGSIQLNLGDLKQILEFPNPCYNE